MSVLSDIFGYLFGALALAGWLYVGAEYFRAARRGRFSVWRRKANGATWPPVRDENPVKFWVYWAFRAGPYLIGSLLVLALMVALVLK